MDRRLNPVAWTEGMFLRPHHLQHLDASTEERFLYHLRASDPFHYGVRKLTLDHNALKEHRVEIQRLDAILPGGQIVCFPDCANVESRKFEVSEQIDVYVGIKRTQINRPNSAPEGGDIRDFPFIRHAEQVPDLHRPNGGASIELLASNVRLFLSGEERELDDYDSFKLAEIHATGDSAEPFALSKRYAPPLLAIQAWPDLDAGIHSLLNDLAGEVRHITSDKRSLSATDLQKILMLYSLARLIPVFRHLLSTGQTHPFPLYSLLVETAGALGAMNFEKISELPPYDHNALYPCFESLIAIIREQRGNTRPDRWTEYEMPPTGRLGFYATEKPIGNELSNPRNAFFLAVRADASADEIRERVTEHKIATREKVDLLSRVPMSGITAENLPAAPADLPFGRLSGFECFQLDPRSKNNLWDEVRSSGELSIFLRGIEKAEIRLYVVAEES